MDQIQGPNIGKFLFRTIDLRGVKSCYRGEMLAFAPLSLFSTKSFRSSTCAPTKASAGD
jgi:hypothetical protein